MPHYIGKQPNGKWFLFSSVTDRFHGVDLENKPEGVEGEYTWASACVWDRYTNNAWDPAMQDLLKAAHTEHGGMASLAVEDTIVNEFSEKETRRYKEMGFREALEAIALHKRKCYAK